VKPASSGTPHALLALAGAAVGAAWLARSRRSLYDVEGRTVLVCGGSRGLGLILARQLADMGAKVAIAARDPDTLDRARADLAARGARVCAVPCDVSVSAQVNEMVLRVRAELGPIDVLINSAGIITVGPVETMTRDDFAEAMGVNFWGPLNAIVAVLPEMLERRQGRIVNVGSIGGKISVPHLVPYSASKFALVGLSEGLRAELRNDGIAVTTVCPGLMRTGSPRHARFKGRARAEFAWFNVSDTLPGPSMSADRAARQIIRAFRRGDGEVILSVPAKLAATLNALMPSASATVLSTANRLLPHADPDAGTHEAKGRDSGSRLAPSWLTILGERAARRYNQVA
jgi:short-subunit dehydrogenase